MELPLEQIEEIVIQYLNSGRSIQVYNPQERQGNSKAWEKDFAEFCQSQGYKFKRNDNIAPDYGAPLNLDLKTVRIDRTAKTFTVAPLTEREARTGVLTYRIVVLIWRYESDTGRGSPVDAIVVPKEAKSVLTNWSYKGIQVKSGVSEKMIREKGVLEGRRLKNISD